jgi:hypothetical protein
MIPSSSFGDDVQQILHGLSSFWIPNETSYQDSIFVPERTTDIGNLDECGNLAKIADCCFAIPSQIVDC